MPRASRPCRGCASSSAATSTAWTSGARACRVPRRRVYLVESDALYARPTLYTSDPDEHRRFLVLTRAALECCRRMNFRPHLVHSHDWHTAFAPLWLRSNYQHDPVFAGTKSVMTIHNIGYQGAFAASDVGDLDLGPDAYLLHQDDLKAGSINALKHGILHADAVTTVSPTYAREITTPQYGLGMEQALAARGSAVHGILNGVDYEEWDPRTRPPPADPFRPARPRAQGRAQAQFPAATEPETRARARAAVRHREPPAVQKGFDLLIETLPKLLQARDVRVAVVGTGEPRYEKFFAGLAEQFPRPRVVFRRLRRQPGALDRRRERHVPHALAIRALRAQPDVLAALRNHSRSCGARAVSPIPSRISIRRRARARASCSTTSMPWP